MSTSPPCGDISRERGQGAGWRRESLVWLAALIVLVTLVGCVWVIVMAVRHPDPVLDAVGLQILRMPLESAPAPVSAPPR